MAMDGNLFVNVSPESSGQDLGKSKISANRLRLLGLLFTSTGDNKLLTKLLLHRVASRTIPKQRV
jgi:hypothetical protein